jgi:hypothetical protein
MMGAAAFGHRPGRLGRRRLAGHHVDGLVKAALVPGNALRHGRGSPVLEPERDRADTM